MLFQDPRLALLHRFAAFIRAHPDKAYDYRDDEDCIVCQFIGLDTVDWGPEECWLNNLAFEAASRDGFNRMTWLLDKPTPFSVLLPIVELAIENFVPEEVA